MTFNDAKREALAAIVFMQEPSDREGWAKDMEWYEKARHAKSWSDLKAALPIEHPLYARVASDGKRGPLPVMTAPENDLLTSVEEDC